MQLFRLDWWDWDEGVYFLFFHPNKTEEEFKKDIHTTAVKYGREYIESKNIWVRVRDWVEYISEKLPELGYIPVKPILECFSGGMIIDEKDTNWKEYIGEELFSLAVEHNNKIREKL